MTTLVSAVTVHLPDGNIHRNDVPARVERVSHKHTTIDFTTRDLGITIRLTQAEATSLIEALGGTR